MTVRLATYNLLHGMTVLGGVPQPARDDAGTRRRPAASSPATGRCATRSRSSAPTSSACRRSTSTSRAAAAPTRCARSPRRWAPAHWHFARVGRPARPARPTGRTPTADHELAANPRLRWPPSQVAGAGLDDTPSRSTRPIGVGPLYGVGLVSRLPVSDWRTTRFAPAPWSLPLLIPAEPRPRFMSVPDEPRAAIAAVVEGDARAVHRGHRAPVVRARLQRPPAARAAALARRASPGPSCCSATSTCPAGFPAMVTGWQPLLKAATYPVMRPRVQLDHVLVDGLTPEPARGRAGHRPGAPAPGERPRRGHGRPRPLSTACPAAV